MATEPSSVTIDTEVDTPTGWSFEVRVTQPGHVARHLTLRLGWADFEHWSAGACPPSTVAQAVVELALARKADAAKLGDFDAATIRRWFPGADETLQSRLRAINNE